MTLLRTALFVLLVVTCSVERSRAQEPVPAPAPTSEQAPAPAPTARPEAAPPPATPPATQGTPATAANPTKAPYTIRTSSRLVILDLVVSDAKGHAVKGITREHFHITEQNNPQTVLNFDEAGVHMPPADLDIHSTAELDKLAPGAPVDIILLDEFNTRFEDMAFARYSLKKFLERQPGKLEVPTMLIAVSLQSFTVVHDYTQNRQEIISSLDHHFVQYPWQAHNGGWVSERYGTAFLTLRRVAEAVAGHPGHKNMIWIGRGFPPMNFVNLQLDTDQRVYHMVQDCVNMLRDARVTLYTIDPAGIQVNNTYGPDAEFNDPFGGNYEFNKLAKATGGRTLYGRNDVDAEIGSAIVDGASFYTATYRPTGSSDDTAKFRRIKVTVDVPGLTVSTREGYYLAYLPPKVNAEHPSKLLISDLMSAGSSLMVYDGLPVSVTASTADPDSFTVHVEAKGVTWYFATDTQPRYAEVVLVAASFDKKNKLCNQVARVIRVKALGEVPPTGRLERALDLNVKLDHDPKAVRARFVVRMTPQGRIGTADAGLNGAAAPVTTVSK